MTALCSALATLGIFFVIFAVAWIGHHAKRRITASWQRTSPANLSRIAGPPTTAGPWLPGDTVVIRDALLLRRDDDLWACSCGRVHTDSDVTIDLAAGDVTFLGNFRGLSLR